MAYEKEMEALTDDQLREKTAEFKKRVQEDRESLDDILPEAFAVCREGAWRSLGMKHFYVQVIGGIVLHPVSYTHLQGHRERGAAACAERLSLCLIRNPI